MDWRRAYDRCARKSSRRKAFVPTSASKSVSAIAEAITLFIFIAIPFPERKRGSSLRYKREDKSLASDHLSRDPPTMDHHNHAISVDSIMARHIMIILLLCITIATAFNTKNTLILVLSDFN